MSCVFPGFLVIETNRYTDFPFRNISVLHKNLLKEPDGTYKGYRSKNIPVNKESGTYRQESEKNVLLWQRYGTYRQNDNKKVLLKQSNGTYRRKGDKKVLL